MARNNRGNRNRGRGRSRGSSYARPIPEPSNFIEFDLNLSNASAVVSHNDLFSALTAVIPVGNISKYRISSLVFEPITTPTSVPGATSIVMGITGHEFLASNLQKPLRIKLGKDYGDDGMWIVTDGAALTANALPGNEALTDTFVQVVVGQGDVTDWQTQLHVRCAWSDPS